MADKRSTQYASLPDSNEFWLGVANSKTDSALIYLVIQELRRFDLKMSSDVQRIACLAKLQAHIELLDLSITSNPAINEEEDEDLELERKLSNSGY